MATPSTAKAEVGTVKVMFGDVKIVGVDGVVRNTCVGDKVYAKEVIQTAANAVIQIQLADGRMLDLGRNSQIALDETLLGTSGSAVAAAPGNSLADQQARIAAGEDPTKVTDPTAAGPNETSEGSHSAVIVNQANGIGLVTAGYDTNPIFRATAQPVDFEQLPALPVVSVAVRVEVPNQPPPAPPGTPNDVPFARTDVDSIAKGAFLASGNVISGAGTTSGTAGADTPGSEGAKVTNVTSPTGNPAIFNRDPSGAITSITIEGKYGTLDITPEGNYTYTRLPGSPEGVVENFTYTITDGSGDSVNANLIIDIGTPVVPGDEPGGDGAVVTVDGAEVLEGTHPSPKEITFVLTLDRPYASPVEVTYEIRPNTASTPGDFFGLLTATVLIPANTIRVEVPVSIVQDHLVEGNETFNIVITNAVGATINPEANTAQITIIDDDAPPAAADDTYDIVKGQPNNLPSVLTRVDGSSGEITDDSGAGPFEALVVIPGVNDTVLPNGDISIVTAQGGSVVMRPDGTFTYTPPANLTGPDTFVYTMTDTVNGVPTGNTPSSATVTLVPNNQPATVKFSVPDVAVNEAGLDGIGSNAASNSEKIQGTFTISDSDGIADVLLVTINGQPILLAELANTVITTPVGVMTITAFDPTTGVASFIYELKIPVTDDPNQPEQDVFDVTVTDNSESTSAPAKLTIDIVDDLPVARNDSDSVPAGTLAPISGNVITGVGTNDPVGGQDTLGADTATLTNIGSTNVPGNVPTPGPNGELTIQGQYGVLTIKPDGSYTYTRDPGTPGGVADTFRYTLTDGDGDTVQANLVIDIGDAPVELQLKNSRVDEAGLPTGSDPGAPSETTAGAITFNAKDGLQGVTVDGVTITPPVPGQPPQTIVGDHGTLTVTGFSFDPITGNGTITYSYTLTSPTSGDTTSDPFDVVVTDNNGGTSSGKLVIDILDDAPTARDDTDSIAAGSLDPAVGNVITATGTTSGTPGADISGADVTARITAVSSTNTPGSLATVNPDGSIVIAGQYGTLTIQPNGEYSYARTPGSPGGVTETFRYTLTDADGDSSAANLTINIGNAAVALSVPGTQVQEEGLPTGSAPTTDGETTTGIITFNAKDGLQSVTVDGVVITPPAPGQPPQTIVGDHGTLTVTGFTYDPITGNGTVTYSYTLTSPTQGDTTTDDFPVVITEQDGDTAKATLTVSIVDDVPVARNDLDTLPAGSFGPETGNVITGVGTVGAPGPDTKGADNATLTAIASTNVPGNLPTVNPDGSITVAGQYGVLTIKPNGDYSYTRNPGTPGDVVDVFRYTLTDGDGDASAANLTINIGDLPGVLDVPAAEVKEAGLPARGAESEGSDEPANSETTAGALTFKTVDGLGSLTLDGVAITPPAPGQPPQTIVGDHGTLTVTGLVYDPVTGNGTLTYTYTLTDNTNGDTTSDDFAVVVTDKDGDKSEGTVRVNIIDDLPIARNDSDSVNGFAPESGNVITGAGTTSGAPGRDTQGADSAQLTEIASTNVPGNTSAVGPNGELIIQGQYGVLTIKADGSYTYLRDPGTPGGVVDTFRYTLTDSDGDKAPANLVINISDKPPELNVPAAGSPGTQVDEAGLPVRPGETAGSDAPSDKEKTNGVITFKAEDGPPTLTIDNVQVTGVAGQQIPGDHGTLTVTGYTYDPVTGNGTLTYDYVLTDNTSGDTTSDPFDVVITDKDGDQSSATLTIAIVDDIPSISVTAAPPNALQVDETNLAQDTTVNFGTLFTSVPGADGATIAYSLDVKSAGADSGLVDVATGLPIVLVKNPATGNVEGHVGDPNGAVAFELSVNPANGAVTLDQRLPMRHPNAGNPDDEVSLGAADLVTLKGTITDGDGDVRDAVLNLGDAISFKDDGPNIDPSNAPLPSLVVDESTLAVNATANFAANFSNSFGADGAGAVVYGLNVGAVASGLKDVATDADIVLVKTPAGVIEGRAGVGGPVAFTVTVAANGDVTLDQVRALKHPNAANPDDAVSLAPGSLILTATSTDKDGDSDAANLNIGGALTFEDDGPSFNVNNTPVPVLTVDETNLTVNATANFAGNFSPVFGADGAGTVAYTLNTAGGPSGLTDVASGQPVVLVKNGDTIEGRVGDPTGAIAFTVAVNPTTGAVTLDQQRALTHPNAANPDDAVTLVPGAISLQATVTDKDGDTATGNLNIGGALTFKDDGPNIDPSAAPLPSLVVDESTLAVNATANFAANFSNSFGADGAGAVVYGLNVGAVASGLKDVATDADIVLVKTPAGVIEGRAGVGGPVAFTVTVAANGDVTLDQVRALKHPNAANPDDAVSLAPGSLILTATSTDKDGDSDAANLNIGGALTFEDDGPSFNVNNTPVPVLTVDETNLTVNATANFAGNFSPVFGADGAGTVAYTLNTAGGPSGLTDVASGQPVVLVKNGDTIEGRVGDPTGAIAFTVAVNPTTGAVTLDQQRALTHPNAANPDDAVTLVPGAISLQATVTDKDGDTATGNLNIGGALTFKDDGPNIDPSTAPLPSLVVDESTLAVNATANFAANFSNSFGADGAGAVVYGLNVGAVASGLKDVATDADIVLVKTPAGVIEGRAGVGGPVAFTVTVAANGDVTLDQVRALKHPNAANPDDAVSLAPGSLILTATSTDKDGDSDAANLNIGGALTFEDDGPSFNVNNTPVPVLTVDETNLTVNATANFAGNFSPVFGADGAGTVAYTLNTAGGPSGLTDVASGQPVVLVKNGDTIEGRVGDPTGAIAFTVAVNPATGAVTLDQQRALTHPNAANPDDAVTLVPGAISLQATVTDKDGDTATGNLNIGGALTFKDDGPNIDPSTAPLPSLVVDESTLAVNATANFAANFTNSFGADGAGAVVYGLNVGAVASGLKDVATDADIVLVKTPAGVIEGRAGVGGPVAFTVTVAANGEVTLDQLRALKHPNAANPDDAVSLAPGSLILTATSTDKDGDSDAANLNIGGALTFEDDGPTLVAGAVVVGRVDEDGLVGANIDAGRAGEVAGTGLATVSGAAGALNALVSVGADQPGNFGFGSDLSSLTAQNLTSNGVALTYSVSGDTLTAKAGALDVFTLQITSAGGYTFTLKDQLDHPTLNGVAGDNTENTIDVNFGSVVRVTDRDGDSVTLGTNTGANFKITVQDDIPVAADIHKSTALEVGAVTNLTLVLDVSGSMSTHVTIGGKVVTRLDAEKQSAKDLIDEYAALGPVKVTVVTFADVSKALGYWMDANAAKAAIDSIGAPNGTTNYAAGLDKAKLGYDGTAGTSGLLPNAQDVLYFLSDGVPNPTATGLDTAAEVTAWESFLKGSAGAGNALGQQITAYALGMGPDVAAAQLNPIAFNGVTNTNTNAIIVSDFSQLTQTLLSTVQFQPVAGNLITDPNPDASFGADAKGWVQVLNIDGKTYVYDQKTDTTTGSTGTNGTFDTVTNQWTVTTANGGKVVVDMDDGAYVYTPPSTITGAKVENIGFTLTDTDGDTASANLKINVEGPTLVVGQNVNDQPGQTTPHKVDPVPGNTGLIGGGGSNDVLIGDVGGGNLVGKSANVIMMMDTSGSMGESFGTNQPSRLQGLKDGVKNMLDTLASSGAENVRVHLNHFGATLKGAATYDLVVNGVVNTANLNAAKSFVNNLTADGFTNYEASLNEALQWIDGPNELSGSNVINQAIFVSDGEPNTALTGNTNTPTSSGSLTAAQAMDHIQGDGSGDTVSEIAGIESRFGAIQAIGMGLSSSALNILSQVEGAGGSATNTTNAQEFKNVLTNLNPNTALGAVGNDIINGGSGGDIIYGDSVNTDVLGAAKGLNLPTGSGWKVFETLEAGAGWTRTDTINYIRTHQDEMAAESTGTGGVKRTGGNDTLDGGSGNDVIYGQEGNDIITGGAGNDILSGGSGADTFKWSNADKGTGATPAIDTVKDFNPTSTAASKDVLDLRDLLQGENAGNLSSYLSFSQTGADVTLSVQSAGAAGAIDQKIVLQGVTMAQLAGSNPADSAGVIANLLANNKLITD